jgi:hypothetical protein
MRETFDRVVCVSLDRRPERWARFEKNVASISWPFLPVQRFRAIDGLVVPPPVGWVSGPGAWGCMQSHRRILEEAIQDNLSTLLVLEDDAFFPRDFADSVSEFLSSVPADWDCLMLGGQHLHVDRKPPVPVAPGVLRCTNCQRTHAYALKKEAMLALYQRWHSWTPKTTGHCDHIMGPFMASRKTYAPADGRGRPRMLVGQDHNRSDIAAGREVRLTFWDPPDPLSKTALVTGGGTPDPAAWRDAGYHMGYWIDVPTGMDNGLRDIFGRPKTTPQRVIEFRKWLETLKWEAASLRPACTVAVWLGPYYSDETAALVRSVCGNLLTEIEEVPVGRASSPVGNRAAVADGGQEDVPKRRRQTVRRRGGGRGRKR